VHATGKLHDIEREVRVRRAAFAVAKSSQGR